MRAMTPEDYLMQVKNIDLRICSLQGELHDAEKEKDSDYAKELRKQIEDDIAKHKELKLRIRNEIQQLPDNRLSTLLIEYYVRGKSWEQVAIALGLKDEKNVRNALRPRALKLFASYFPKYFL